MNFCLSGDLEYINKYSNKSFQYSSLEYKDDLYINNQQTSCFILSAYTIAHYSIYTIYTIIMLFLCAYCAN